MSEEVQRKSLESEEFVFKVFKVFSLFLVFAELLRLSSSHLSTQNHAQALSTHTEVKNQSI